jgi:signal transduction histidine kinase
MFVADGYINLGNIYTDLKAFSTARTYLRRGLHLFDSLKVAASYFVYAYRSLARLDSLEGNYKRAYFNYQKYIAYRDSSVNVDKMRQSLLTTMQFEQEKTAALAKAEQEKREAEQLRIQNRQYFFMTLLGLALLAGLLIAYLQWRYKRQKQNANTLLQEQKQRVEKAYTELKATQQQLIQKEKMASLGELTAGIAHEIQNPLNFVNNFSAVNKELLEEMEEEIDKGNYGEVKVIVNDIKTNEEKIAYHGRRADGIVKSMMEHSQGSHTEKQSTDLNALTEEYLKLAYHGYRAKDKAFSAGLKTQYDPSMGTVSVVPQEIGRVLLNLFNNAFYAVQEKKAKLNGTFEPTIIISTRKEGNNILITVKDNGIGMSQQVATKVFQPFFTTKPTGESTGLGLSLSYDIVTKGHGGNLFVQSKEGEGSEFVVELPAS